MGSGLSIFTGSRTRNVVVILFLIAAYTRYRRLHAKFLKFRNRKPPVLTAIGKVKTITIFPVKVQIKSCRGISVSNVKVTANGFENDRVMMVINKNKVPITQRMIPELARVTIKLYKESETVSIEPPGKTSSLELKLSGLNGAQYTVDLHGIPSKCVDYGDEVGQWLDAMLSELTGKEKSGYRMVRILEGEARRVYYSPAKLLLNDARNFDGTYLSDLAPLTLTSEASLKRLNDEIDVFDRVPMDRFRSNLVLDTPVENAFLEDECKELKIGNLHLRVIGPVFRCVIPSVDQETGEAGFRKDFKCAEPVATLKKFRNGGLRYGVTGLLPITMGGSKGLAPLFGVYLGVKQQDVDEELSVGDNLTVLSYY